MQNNNIIKAIPLEDVFKFIMTIEPTEKELNIIHSHGFFLAEYFIQDNCIYYTFKRRRYYE